MQLGIDLPLPADQMCAAAEKLRANYARQPDAPFHQREFGFYSLNAWKSQGLDANADLNKIFSYDPPGNFFLHKLGWCEAAFVPNFDEYVVEDRGRHELVQDIAGRHVLYFKGRRHGFMPEYIAHPVSDFKSWENNVKWRLAPSSPQRYADLSARMEQAQSAARQGLMITQNVIGGYMYLRSLIGPETLLYAFYDMPALIHDCMRTWLALADRVTAAHQQFVTIDELFLGEDICYNTGPLIGPDMIKEFLFPYYQQLISNIKYRQLDRTRHLYVHVDSDGHAMSVINLYQKHIGMDVMSPFEVASGCDVVKVARDYPELVILGGIDKRILARSPQAIDTHVEYILPAMRKRGGYIPTCDHGVPEEVTLENYIHYRRRCLELGN